MNESAQEETQEETKEKQKAPINYDANANRRLEFEVKENGEIFDTAHIFKPLSDTRYLQWLDNLNVQTDSNDEVKEDVKTASISLWNDLIVDVENIEKTEDWKDKIPAEEKQTAIQMLLTVAIVETESRAAKGKVRTFSESETRVITTEIYADWTESGTHQQTHTLTVSEEFKKKFTRIQRKQYKEETIKGLRRKPKYIFVPQDEKFGELYDEMSVSTTGFENRVELRFKKTVLHDIFESKYNPKK